MLFGQPAKHFDEKDIAVRALLFGHRLLHPMRAEPVMWAL